MRRKKNMSASQRISAEDLWHICASEWSHEDETSRLSDFSPETRDRSCRPTRRQEERVWKADVFFFYKCFIYLHYWNADVSSWMMGNYDPERTHRPDSYSFIFLPPVTVDLRFPGHTELVRTRGHKTSGGKDEKHLEDCEVIVTTFSQRGQTRTEHLKYKQ